MKRIETRKTQGTACITLVIGYIRVEYAKCAKHNGERFHRATINKAGRLTS